MEATIIYEKPPSGAYPEQVFGNSQGNTTWVLFSNRGLDEWVGIFGHAFSYCGLMKIQALKADRFMIFAGAAVYIVDAKSRTLLDSFEDAWISDAVFDEMKNELVVADHTRLLGISKGQQVWKSKRIALDGLRDLTILEGRILGLAEFYEGQVEPFEFDCETHEITCKQTVGWD